MKRQLLTLLAAIALLTLGARAAAPQRGHVMLPGFSEKQLSAKAPLTPDQLKAEASRLLPGPKRHASRPSSPSNQPPRYAISPRTDQTETVDRLVGYTDHTSSGDIDHIISYDEYGFMDTISTPMLGNATIFKYEWEIPGKIWNKKESHFLSNGNEYSSTSETRTFHPNGSVATITTPAIEPNIRIQTFDENGYLISDKVQSPEGEVFYEEKYIFFEKTQEWLRSEINDYHRRTIQLDGDNGYYVLEEMIEDGTSYLSYIWGHWYDQDGNNVAEIHGSCTWGDSGNLERVYLSGSRMVYSYDAEGNIVATIESINTDQTTAPYPENLKWDLHATHIYSSNFYAPYVYEEGEVRFYKEFDKDGNLIREKNFTWENPLVYKLVEKDYRYDEEEISYNFYDPENDYYEYGIYFDATTGAFGTWDLDEDNQLQTYTYYSSDCTITGKFRCSYADFIDKWEMLSGDEWVPCSGEITMYRSDTHWSVLKFDSKNRLTYAAEYSWGELESYMTYDYTAFGWTCWEFNTYHTRKTTLYTDASGIVTRTQLEYCYNDEIEYGFKEVYNPNKHFYVNYDYQDGEWVETNCLGEPTFEYGEDGRKITTFYGYDRSTETAFPIFRSIYLDSPTHYLHENYYWDEEQECFIGENKGEKIWIEKPDFSYQTPNYPIGENEEYFFETSKDRPYNEPSGDWYYYYWEWNDEISDWVNHNSNPTTYEMPDELTLLTHRWVMNDYESLEQVEYVEKIRVNSDRFVVEEISYPWYNEDYNETSLYGYDEQGRWTSFEKSNSLDGVVESRTYRYGPVEIITLGVDGVGADAADGRVTVYNLQGIMLMRDAERASLSDLPDGIYIVNGMKTLLRR